MVKCSGNIVLVAAPSQNISMGRWDLVTSTDKGGINKFRCSTGNLKTIRTHFQALVVLFSLVTTGGELLLFIQLLG